MIARIQQIFTLSLLVVSILWVAYFWYRGDQMLGLAGPILVFLGYAMFLGVEFLLSALLGGESAESSRARWPELARAWLGEIRCTPAAFCWRQPFRSAKEPDLLTGDASGRRGVVLVHGFVCNRGFWNPWMEMLRRRGIPFVAVNLEPPFGSITAYPAIIEAAACNIEAATGKLPVLVAHSMGGLAVRAWLADCRRPRAHRVITIASPHRGTWLARFGHALNTIEMRLSSNWIRALERREGAVDRNRFICFYSDCDNIVFPAINATLPGADNRHLPATAHVQMAQHPEVMREVLKWITPAAEPADAEPGRFGAVDSKDRTSRG